MKHLNAKSPGFLRVASSREDAWIETQRRDRLLSASESRPPARTRGLKQEVGNGRSPAVVASSREDAWIETVLKTNLILPIGSRPPARTRGLKQELVAVDGTDSLVASSREDAWIETQHGVEDFGRIWSRPPARTRGLKHFSCFKKNDGWRRVLPRGRVD